MSKFISVLIGLAQAAKVHAGVITAALVWAAANLPDQYQGYVQVAVIVLGAVGIYQAPRTYGVSDSPADPGHEG